MTRSRSIYVAALLGAFALLAGGCGETPDAGTAAESAAPVRAGVTELGPGLPPIRTNGTVVAKDEMRLSFLVGGVIREIAVNEGDAVKRGQRLASIERTAIDAEVEQARQLAAKATRDLERGERLHRDEVISLEQLQDLRTQSAVATARLESARYSQGYAVITAPGDGVVLRRLAEVRETVPAGQPVLIVGANAGGFVVETALADRQIVQVKPGDPARIRMDALPGQVLDGRVTEVAGAADERSGLFRVQVQLDEPPTRLVSGLLAKVSIEPHGARERSLTYVPVGAVVSGVGNVASVYTIVDGVAHRRDVEVAFFDGDRVAVSAGIGPGEPVVLEGALYLEDGERVEIVER